MPRFSLTIECATAADLAAVAHYLDAMPGARSSPREPGDDDEAPPPPRPQPPKGRDAPAAAVQPIMTGTQLLGWIGDQPDPKAALRRAQNAGKRLGYGWQIKSWRPNQVADVCREIRQHGQMGAKT